uniref:DDE-1 domain-containing protein n=1 Tax=Branchiostoma floridae TaxID=7739 RepID=C3YB50_BRAFL|eukprot:XP_002606502.1 hypothetical protein BRAFLDRAFT_91915 [Branchiostoma floridae]
MEADRQVARQAGSQTDRKVYRQGVRQTWRETDREQDRRRERHTGSHTDWEADRQRARHSGSQTDMEPERHVERQTGSRTDEKRDRQGARQMGYLKYTPETRAKVARLAMEIGPQTSVETMSKEVGKQLSDGTVRVRSIKKSYKNEVKRQGTNVILSLPRKNVGKPLKLGNLDAEVQKFVWNTKDNEGVVNRLLVMSAARGIMLQKDRSLLSEFGGHIDITKAWANSVLDRMNYVQRKSTKSARKLPTDYKENKADFHTRIQDAVREHNIPDEMIVNWDQTGVPIVPRFYQGKTDACHPVFNFAEERDVHHTAYHWSTEDSMNRYIDTSITPYMDGQWERLNVGHFGPLAIRTFRPQAEDTSAPSRGHFGPGSSPR